MSLSSLPDELTIEVLDYTNPEDLLLILRTVPEVKRWLLDLRIRPKLKKYLETCTLPLQTIKCYCRALDLNYDQMVEARNPFWSLYALSDNPFVTSSDYPLNQYVTYHQTPFNLRDPEVRERFFEIVPREFFIIYIGCFIRQFTLPRHSTDATTLETKMAIHRDFMEHQTLRLICLRELLIRINPDEEDWESMCRGITVCLPPAITQTLLAYRSYPSIYVPLIRTLSDNAQNAIQPHYWAEYEPIAGSLI